MEETELVRGCNLLKEAGTEQATQFSGIVSSDIIIGYYYPSFSVTIYIANHLSGKTEIYMELVQVTP